ncbi:MAG: response regulator [Solirubrobacteraceae bacterium]
MAEPLRVLICDDSLGFPTLVQTWLREDGRFTVVGLATGGEEAKQMVAEHRPELIVLDLVLPDAPDSPTLVAALRSEHPALRVLLVSSMHTERLEAAARAADADGFCNKGAKPGELTERLYAIA